MKQKILLLITMFSLVITSLSIPTYAQSNKYTDVQNDAWYAKSVNAMSEKGMILGVGDGKYNPNSNVTRAEFLALLLRIYDGKDVADNPDDKTWMDKYILYARELNLIDDNGYEKYIPEYNIKNYWSKPIPRSQVAQWINQLMNFDQIELKDPSNTTLPFDDISDPKYKDEKDDIIAIAGTIMIGESYTETRHIHEQDDEIITYYRFNPSSSLKRSEIAEIMYRLYNYKYDKNAYAQNLTKHHFAIELRKLIALESENYDAKKLKQKREKLYLYYKECAKNNSNFTVDDLNQIYYDTIKYHSNITLINEADKNKIIEIAKSYIYMIDNEEVEKLAYETNLISKEKVYYDSFDFSDLIINDTNKLIKNYKEAFDLDTITLSIVFSEDAKELHFYNTTNPIKIKISGTKNGAINEHFFFINYHNYSHLICDSWEAKLQLSDFKNSYKQPKTIIKKELDVPECKEETEQKLTTGGYVEYYPNDNPNNGFLGTFKIVIKDSNKKAIKTITMPGHIGAGVISNDGIQIAYTTTRGVYISDLDFKNPRLVIANNLDGPRLKVTKWSSDNKQLVLMEHYEEPSAYYIFDIEKNSIVGNLQMTSNFNAYSVSQLLSAENKLLLRNWDDINTAIFDYKNNILYYTNNKQE